MKNAQLLNNQLIRISVLLIAVATVTIIPYDTIFDETKVVCIHSYLFGFQCPLCGMTRAVYQFIHFQFASAIGYNVVVALLPCYLLVDITTIFFRKNWLVQVRKTIVILIIAGFLLLYAFRIASHFNWL